MKTSREQSFVFILHSQVFGDEAPPNLWVITNNNNNDDDDNNNNTHLLRSSADPVYMIESETTRAE